MIDYNTKVSELPYFILEEWKPINFFPYTTLIDGIWKEKEQWEQYTNTNVVKLYYHCRYIVTGNGYETELFDKKRISHQWDNKVAIEILNTVTNETLFIGLADWNICIGSKISSMDSWIKPCPVQY